MEITLIDYLFDQRSYDSYVRERLGELYKDIFFDDEFFYAFWEAFGYSSFREIKSIDIVGFMLQYALDKAKEEMETNEELSQKDKEYLLKEIENVYVDSGYGYSLYVGVDEFFENVSKNIATVRFSDLGNCCRFVYDVQEKGIKNLIKEG